MSINSGAPVKGVPFSLQPESVHVSLPAMKNRIISLYLVREIAGIFVLALFIFTLVLLMGRMVKLMEMVIANGVPFLDVVSLVLLLLPSFLVLTIPMAFLLAVLLAFGRLSGDNEITVLKTSGLSLSALIKPVMLCALVAAAMTLFISLVAAPWGSIGFKQLSMDLARKYAASAIRERIFRDDIPGIVLYVDSYDEARNSMKRVMIHDARDPERPLTIFARDGVAASDESLGTLRILLRNGAIHTQGRDGEYRQIGFAEYMLTFDAGKMAPIVRTEVDMGIRELLRISGTTASQIPQIKNRMMVELHSRFVFPFAAIVFGLLAMPLGLQNKRTGRTSGYAVSIAVLLSYYILISFLKTLAEKGSISPAVALWMPNLIFLILAVLLLRLSIQERSLRDVFRWRVRPA